MPVVSPQRVRDDLARLVQRELALPDLTHEAARIIARAVPFDGVCVLAMDPATMLPTAEVVENGLPPAVVPRMTELELRGQDVNTFRGLARGPRRAATLGEATGGDLDRSVRHRELKRPHGFGDELRALLVDRSAVWGGLTLLRGADQRHFTAADTALVASCSGLLAEGVRRATLATARSGEPGGGEERAGLALLGPDNAVAMADDDAARWLSELGGADPGGAPPAVVGAVAHRARGLAEGDAAGSVAARARVRTASGRWLLVRGSSFGDDDAHVAVTFEPAPAHELAPLIAHAYGLTDRERSVTELVAQGLPTDAIGARLHLSSWTVQDHLKAIFEKTGVSSRGELVARLFFEHREPRLTDA